MLSALLAFAVPASVSALKWLPAATPQDSSGKIRGLAINHNCGNSQCLSAETAWMTLRSETNASNSYCLTGHKKYCGVGLSPWAEHLWVGVAPLCPGSNRCQLCPANHACVAKDSVGNGLPCVNGQRALCVDRAYPHTHAMEVRGTTNRADAVELCRLHGHTLPYVRTEKQHDLLVTSCKQAIEEKGLPANSKCHTAMAHTADGLVYHDDMVHSDHFEFHNFATADGKPEVERMEPDAGQVVIVDAATGKWETVSEEAHAVVLCNNNGLAWRQVMFGNVMDCGDDTSVFDASTFAIDAQRAQDMKDATKEELQARGINYPFNDFWIDGDAINSTQEGAAQFGYEFNQYGLVWQMVFASEPLARKALDDAITQSGFGQGIYDRLDKTLYPAGCTMRDQMMDANVFPITEGKGKGKGKGKGGPPKAVRALSDDFTPH